MVTVEEELERALKLAGSGILRNATAISPLCSPGLLCPPGQGKPPGPCSLNEPPNPAPKSEQVELEEPRDHHVINEKGARSSKQEIKGCFVEIEKVEAEKSGRCDDTALKKRQKKQAIAKSQVECDECGKFYSKAFMLSHKSVAHGGEKPFPCTDCNQRFSRKSRVEDHMRIAHGYPKLKCKVEGCDSEFSVYSKLGNHMHTHKTKIECGECGIRLSEAYLPKHIKFFHQGKSSAVCEISGCGKRFINSTHLPNHMRSVHGFPKLKCNVEKCTAEFVSKGGLLKHKKCAHS